MPASVFPQKRSAMAPHPRLRSAFTLIELLVVISIIALLIGILLPALGAARETARQAQCLSNTRQVTIALSTYATDNQAYFPPTGIFDGELGAQGFEFESGGDPQLEWFDNARLGYYMPGSENQGAADDPNASYGGTALACPSDRDRGQRSYAMNAYASAIGNIAGQPGQAGGLPLEGNGTTAVLGEYFRSDVREGSNIILIGEAFSQFPRIVGGNTEGWLSISTLQEAAIAPDRTRQGAFWFGATGNPTVNFSADAVSTNRFNSPTTISRIDYTRHGGNDDVTVFEGGSSFSFVDGHSEFLTTNALYDGDQSTYEAMWSPVDRETR
ncbi:MAG: DUF1559 domain-containing protein [Planctomycetota bacterium]